MAGQAALALRVGSAAQRAALALRPGSGRRLCSSGPHPVVDVAPILADGHPRRQATLQSIRDALQRRGYFYAKNVEVLPAEYIAGVYAYARRLHALPPSVKRHYSQRDGHGAYSGPDIGQPELAYDPGTTATVRAWDYSRTRFTLKKSDDPGQNRYPDPSVIQPPYIDVLDSLYERQDELARALMRAFAECLGLSPHTLVDMFDGGDFGTIRLLSYPAMSTDEAHRASMGISAHTDFEAFTLMHQDAPGLQFIPASGKGWVDAPVRPGEFVVIIGDVLERFTNGLLRATPHRVVVTPHERSSIIRFNAVSADTVVEPLPQFVTADRPAAYTPVTMRTHMETTMRNLERGLGAWDNDLQTSLTATYRYGDEASPGAFTPTEARQVSL